jgi:hypothetical protein
MAGLPTRIKSPMPTLNYHSALLDETRAVIMPHPLILEDNIAVYMTVDCQS